ISKVEDMRDAIIEVIDEFDGDTELTKDYAEAMVADLIGAGMDTVSTALHWIVLLPAKHPDIHTKLHELTDRVDEADCHLMRTEYTCVTWIPSSTRQCVSPVLSLSPSPTQKPQMSLWGGLRIPKDTVIFINQWSVNHDPLRKWIADQFEIFLFFDFSLKCSCGLTLKPLDYKITAKLRGELLKNKYVSFVFRKSFYKFCFN
uniref:Cytochrome P450, family 1, subfamily C, polypeptide 1 n=1 Tax=Poecilia latipinna TaxID=48699 RepID=A0A3B3UV87_9TELE